MELLENVETRRRNSRREFRPRIEKFSRERKKRSSSYSMEMKNMSERTKGKDEKIVIEKLPSPPPDPRAEMFAERVIGYENSACKAAANVLGVDDAFDHLDKLHGMIEEIIEMRERNAKLFRRVRDLERVRVTRKAHFEIEKNISMGQDLVLPDEDVGFAESLLGAMLSSSFELSPLRNNSGRSITTGSVTRSRSIGMEHRRVSCPVTTETRQRIITRIAPKIGEIKKKRPLLGFGTPKVSKWTRVKAAFKWERAACTNNENVLIEQPEVAVRYLKIPENTGGSTEISGPPTPVGTISSSSSIDDVFHRPQRPSSNQSTRITRRDESTDPTRRSRSLDGDASVPMNFVYSPRTRSKDNPCLHGRSDELRTHKTPWGKVKDMMQLRRESVGRQTTRSISRNDDGHSTSSLESSDIHRSEPHVDGRPPIRVRISGETSGALNTIITKTGSINCPNDLTDLASRRLTPTLTITVPSSEELRNISSPESTTPPPPSASPRQSYESGKSERYSQPGYETPKETRTGQVSPASSSSGILRYGLGRSKTCQGVPYAGDYKRQQSLKGESLGSSPKMQRRDSKWNKVKRAFLTSATSVPTSPNRISSYFFDDGDATGGSYSASASAEDLENDIATSPGVQAEIQRNYRLLHDKLGTEFYRKLAEWERLKSNNQNIRDPSRSNAREKDDNNLRLLGEERLTPEFKKKLEEWKRMNKGAGEARGSNSSENRSVNRRRITDWQLWRSPSKPDNKSDSPRLSEDFIKKMEEWKRIKSASSRRETEVDAEIRQPRETRVDGEEYNEEDDEEEEEEVEEEEEEEESISGTRHSEERRKAWKSLEDEEFKSLERVLEAMEMDRQTRLSKLQRIVGSQPQKTQEVLIHTSTGLYRFEGISRKFTRKLYEWEKSQGISPELSTFRLLDPLRHGVGSPRIRSIAVDVTDDGAPRKSRHRSKSVGCGEIDSWRTTRDHEKSTIRRPCSLSLNDIDNMDARSCIIASSVPTIPDEEDITSEDIAMEDSEAEPEQEPEAVIVDIEDVIEETASPLTKYQPHQTPVYSVAGSETTSIAIPLGTVTARHEPSPVILIEPGEMHPLRAHACSINAIDNETFYAPESDGESIIDQTISTSSTDDKQRSIAGESLRAKRETFDENNDKLSIREENNGKKESKLVCSIDDEAPTELDDSDENWQMAPLMRLDRNPRNFVTRESISNDEEEAFEDAVVTVRSNARHTKKLLKTRRLTDTQVGYDWRSINQPTTSNVSDQSEGKEERSADRSLTEIVDDFEDNPNIERIIINEETLNKIVVPTASSSSSLSLTLKLDEEDCPDSLMANSSKKEKREATSVFVKTKRIVFSPFRRETKNKMSENLAGNSNSDTNDENFVTNFTSNSSDSSRSTLVSVSTARESNKMDETLTEPSTSRAEVDFKRPPLPRSPILARKEYRMSSNRETSPSIRMMIRRYNEKLDIEVCPDRISAISSPSGLVQSSGASSCSGGSSPSWRTPVTERRFFKPLDRYDEAKKPLSSRNICCQSCNQSCDHSIANLTKSSSVDYFRQCSNLETRREKTIEPEASNPRPGMEKRSSSIPSEPTRYPENDFVTLSTVRAMKIRRARENFLSMGPYRGEPEEKKIESTALPGNLKENEREKNESGEVKLKDFGARIDLAKSASAGMINIDENTYERLTIAADEAAGTERTCDSLPRSNEHLRQREKETTSRFSQIANKFKRARLRRSREKETLGMSTVSRLCRQSLLVDIANGNSEGNKEGEGSKGNSKTTRRKDDEEGKNNEDRRKNTKF